MARCKRRSLAAAGRAARAARRQHMENRNPDVDQYRAKNEAGSSGQRLPMQNITNMQQHSNASGLACPASQWQSASIQAPPALALAVALPGAISAIPPAGPQGMALPRSANGSALSIPVMGPYQPPIRHSRPPVAQPLQWHAIAAHVPVIRPYQPQNLQPKEPVARSVQLLASPINILTIRGYQSPILQLRAPTAQPLQPQEVVALLRGFPADILVKTIQNAPPLRQALLAHVLAGPYARPAPPP